MNSPHPYNTAAQLLSRALASTHRAHHAHDSAAVGQGSDTETARHIRATIRSLRAYLAETSQPDRDEDEDERETAHAAAARKYHSAAAAHADAQEEHDKAFAARDAADLTAHRAQTKANDAENKLRNAAAAYYAAQSELAQHIARAKEDRK